MKILKFSELRQTYRWDCGAKAIQAVLAYYGVNVRGSLVIELAGTNRSGTPISGIKKVAKEYDLEYKAGKMTIEDIKSYLDRKTPVILLVQAWTAKDDVDWENDWIDGHYVVAIGYDKARIYFKDPSSVSRVYLEFDEFKKRWHDVGADSRKYINWGMAVFGKTVKYNPSEARHMD